MRMKQTCGVSGWVCDNVSSKKMCREEMSIVINRDRINKKYFVCNRLA